MERLVGAGRWCKRLLLVALLVLYIVHRVTDRIYLTGDFYRTVLNLFPIIMIVASAYVVYRWFRRHLFSKLSLGKKLAASVALAIVWFVIFMLFPIQIWAIAVILLLLGTSFGRWDNKSKEKTKLAVHMSALLTIVSVTYPVVGMFIFHAQDLLWLGIACLAAGQLLVSWWLYNHVSAVPAAHHHHP